MTPESPDDFVPRIDQLEELYRRLALAHLEDRENLVRLSRASQRQSAELNRKIDALTADVHVLVKTMDDWIRRNPGTNA